MQRKDQMIRWLSQHMDNCSIVEHFGDASFRSYWRIESDGKTFVVMDAPPDKEDCVPFVKIDKAFKQQNLHVPSIYQQDLEQGFLLLEDFGNQMFYQILDQENVNTLYSKAIDDLHKVQNCNTLQDEPLPEYHEKWMNEDLKNFSTWFIGGLLNLHLSATQKSTMTACYKALIGEHLRQPRCCMHFDYHSKNLMLLSSNEIGVLDFQDAMTGCITFDLASLLRDSYVDWPIEQVYGWVDQFYTGLCEAGKLSNVPKQLFYRWFDLTSMQRHLRSTFIFARKHLRDNDSSYLKYIPRTLNYIKYVCHKYPEYSHFEKLFLSTLLTAWNKQ